MIVTFLPINKKIEIEKEENLYRLAMENGIDLGGTCGGKKTCGKCKVLITKGNDKSYLPEELDTLSEEEKKKGIRLACCVTVTNDMCAISMIPNKDRDENLHGTSESTKVKQIRKDGLQYGVAFDIGTTNVVAQLWDITNKEKLSNIERPNPQSLYGKDVISRITYGSESKENLGTLTSLIRNCCNQLIEGLIKAEGINKEDIVQGVVAANTTMTQIFCGHSVEGLRKVPVIFAESEGGLHSESPYKGKVYKAEELGIQIQGEGSIYVLPSIGGHVGSDILAGLHSINRQDNKENFLFIDIGTNGEIALCIDGKVSVCSTAAGPAFEGAVLQQGMTASDGAITKVEIKEDRFILDYIGNEKKEIYPIGICGPGALEAVYELIIHGKMDETGRLLGEYGDNNYVPLYDSEKGRVILTQKDIREIQLAKGAIYAGCMTLLKTCRISIGDIDRIYIAGAFGSHLDVKKAMAIGLLPKTSPQKIICVGNQSLEGAGKMLLEEKDLSELEKISTSIDHIDLALDSSFEEEFIDAISF